jgi:hypothetical protein
MGEVVWKARIEDDGVPIEWIGDAVTHLVTGRRLHPAVGRQDPEGREQHTDSNDDRRERVQPRRHPLPAEQQHAEKCRFEKEGYLDLVADHGTDHIAENG